MICQSLLTASHTFPFSPSISNVTNYYLFPIPTSRRFTLHHRLSKTPNFQVVRCSMQENRILEPEDAALLISTCITRTLSPALTLEQGLEKIKEAVEELKAKPPCCSSGMFRFQVAVPPSAKSLNWFCCQPESSGVFPQFFLSKVRENASCKSIVLGQTRGIFGIGAAINLMGFSAAKQYGEFGRCCTVESTPVVAYGFLDLSFDTISSSMKQEAGSFCFFVPQIELAEFEGASILSTTVAWNDSYLCTFEEALQAYESSLLQAELNLSPAEDGYCNHIGATFRKVQIKEGQAQMVYANLPKLFDKYVGPGAVELVSPLS